MRILVADDHPLVRDALARTVTSLDAVVQVIEAADFDALRSQASEHDLDLALVDLNMPGMRGVNGLRALRSEFPTLVLIVASAQDDATTIRMVLATGVSGFIPKTESVGQPCSRPSSRARTTASVRLLTPRLRRIAAMWIFTVPSVSPRSRAISLLGRPCSRHASTSS